MSEVTTDPGSTTSTPAGQNILSGSGYTPPAGSTPAATTPSAPVDWKASLPEEFKNDPSLKPIQDVSALAKSYISAQKMVGADKVVIPGKHATEADWQTFYSKLGRPETSDKYEVALPEGVKADENFLKEFKDTAHKAGLLPNQVKELSAWYNQMNQQMGTHIQAQQEAKTQKGIEELKKEWGQGFDSKANVAHLAVKEFADEPMIKYLEETGLGNDPQLIRLFAKIGESVLSEGKIRGEREGRFGGLTPSEANRKINDIMADQKHPYFDNKHPNHRDAVDEMNKLFQAKTSGSV